MLPINEKTVAKITEYFTRYEDGIKAFEKHLSDSGILRAKMINPMHYNNNYAFCRMVELGKVNQVQEDDYANVMAGFINNYDNFQETAFGKDHKCTMREFAAAYSRIYETGFAQKEMSIQRENVNSIIATLRKNQKLSTFEKAQDDLVIEDVSVVQNTGSISPLSLPKLNQREKEVA